MDRSTAAAVAACLLVVASLSAAAAPGDDAVRAGVVADGGHVPGEESTGPVGAAAAVTYPPTPAANTTARMAIPADRIERAEFATVTPGLGTSLRVGAGDVRDRHRRLTVEREFEGAETATQRQNVIDQALIRLEERSRELRAREAAAIRRFGAGEISAATLLRELAVVDAEARRARETLSLLRTLRTRAEAPWLRPRIDTLAVRFQTLQGPVRDRVAETLAGEAQPTRIHVEASADAVVLSTMVGGQYLREATVLGNRDREGATRLGFDEANDRAEALYPWAFAAQSSTSVDGLSPDAYRVQVFHPQGRLLAFVDATTADVFREEQVLTVSAMPTLDTVTLTDEGLQATLQRTYPGGPLRIVVEDATTDTSVNGRVTVDGHELGATGVDGVVLTLEPRPPYTIEVAAEGGSLNVTYRGPPEQRSP